MGSVINAGAIHRVAQANIDAARIKQKASNDRAISDAAANIKVQDANNAASEVITNAQKTIQTASNLASTNIANATKVLRDTNNAGAKALAGYQTTLQEQSNRYSLKLADTQLEVQRSYNEGMREVADAQRSLRDARNEAAGARSSLALWSHSLGNQRKLEVAGDKVNSLTENILRQADDASFGRIKDRVRTAELLGASTAMAAWAGVGGSTIEQFNSAMELGDALSQERADRAVETMKYQGAQQKGATIKDTIASLGYETFNAELDYNQYLAPQDFTAIIPEQSFNVYNPNIDYNTYDPNLDYTAYVANKDFTVYAPNLDFTQYVDHKKMSFAQRWLTMGAATAATAFAGPQAGMAVLSASDAIQSARNGDYAASNQAWSSTIKSAFGAGKQYNAVGGSFYNNAGAYLKL
ncbi:internal virion protein [Caulobacter phage Lullwater]|uniref:Internal virion protein n=1 Tax=Caulobacter phage Lullwater TaxID=2024607 RepID=A0A291LB44_9CAUD|nr:internal virion protein [Caulobacter phage Lullwater]ATI16344.1 hypothetical protein Lull_037 [Caulobacter phage Lullwater]